MPKIPIIKSKDLLKLLLAYDCELIRINGSHHRLRNKSNGLFGTLPVHNKEQKKGMFVAILRELGIDLNDFIDFIEKH
ncbi:MAG: type II toxin-antitoxin system HicA family toxin [Clostridiales bacterium]|jgi:predicted RNA binding protein YcfA (HicA-like mRNA interferase family)|nr:type II toxin-antitoxin system HicA family toxin [Clostridiales bacterium]